MSCMAYKALCCTATGQLQVRQLRSLYNKIQVILSFDLVSQLPVELSVMVMSYLDARLLCAGAQCCRSWRNMANRDELW